MSEWRVCENWALEPDVGLVTKAPHHAQIMLAGNNFDADPKDM